MSKELINGQIMAKYDEISRIEEEAKNKHASIKDEVKEKYDKQISNMDDKLNSEQVDLEKDIQEKNKWTEKVKELITSTKSIENDLTNLKKEKEKEFLIKIKAIDKAEKTKKKVILKEIKQLEKEKMDIEKIQVEI
ncbi:MAG: hypothetical protein JXA99_06515 [Candidatus Lokiarchaeota archaeon]|nr:hypothetical protein [Candidatus Lokiarchaeota archaeon]